jgi:SAM-dependent methyltransferase
MTMKTMPFCRTLHRLLRAMAFAALLPWSAAAPAQNTPKLDVPYVPTPWEVVDKMLEVARVTGKDTLYDLGCGDGRIVVTAARKHGTRGTGVDINPQRIEEARAGARAAGVEDKVRFMVGNLFETDISRATVVTLYLLPDINLRLRPRLWQQLKVGARVVSHDFDMGEDWPPQRTEKIGNKTVYYWTITEAEKARATPSGERRASIR